VAAASSPPSSARGSDGLKESVIEVEKMTNDEMIQALIKYGDERYPRIKVNREVEPAEGITFKDFIESLSYGNQKQE
jgi:hypothetical protein